MTVSVGQGLKQESLGQCVLKAMKSNISFIIWVKCRNRPRYRTLLTETLKLVYAISYDEVKRYKQSGWMKTTNYITAKIGLRSL